jgi:hypothetical protein
MQDLRMRNLEARIKKIRIKKKMSQHEIRIREKQSHRTNLI